MNFHTIITSPETRMIVLPVGENRMIVASFISTKHRNVTEGRTDRRRAGGTDPIMAYTAVSIASYADGCNKAYTDVFLTLIYTVVS